MSLTPSPFWRVILPPDARDARHFLSTFLPPGSYELVEATPDLLQQTRVSEATHGLVYVMDAPDNLLGQILGQDRSSLASPAEGALRGVLVLYRGGAEPQQPTDKLLELAEHCRHIVESGSQGIAIHQDGRICYANPACARLFGYASPEELLGQEWETLIAPESRPSLRLRAQACLRGEHSPTAQEKGAHPGWQGVRRDGGRVWVESTENLIRWEGRSAVSTFLIDVTERNRLEEHHLHARKMEAVGRLAGGVAHDFNNLLTVINGYSELLLRSLEPNDPSRQLIQGIVEAGERGAALTRQLLAFSRKQVIEPRVLDLNVLVRDLARLLGRLIGEHIQLHTRLQADLERIRADPGQLEQVLMNLVVNARDAMPNGGQITIVTNNVELPAVGDAALTGSAARPFVQLAVSDTGIGMDEATRARLFEPFFTTKETGRGTGLGLATAYGIVQANGGHIEVESAPGLGSRFEIYLPSVGKMTPDSWPPRPGLKQAPTGTETVLLVEDDDSVRLFSRHVLEAQGYAVLEAIHGMEAIQLCQRLRTPVHLLVTDVIMPRMGGPELATWLRQKQPDMAVLFLSGYPENMGLAGEFQEKIGKGIEFLQKPFTPLALAEKVRAVLDQRSS